jgi:hypothetical protein
MNFIKVRNHKSDVPYNFDSTFKFFCWVVLGNIFNFTVLNFDKIFKFLLISQILHKEAGLEKKKNLTKILFLTNLYIYL